MSICILHMLFSISWRQHRHAISILFNKTHFEAEDNKGGGCINLRKHQIGAQRLHTSLLHTDVSITRGFLLSNDLATRTAVTNDSLIKNEMVLLLMSRQSNT